MTPNAILASILAVVLMGIACANPPQRQLNLYPTATPNASATPDPTQTPAVITIYAATWTPPPSPAPFQPYAATVAGAWNCHAAADVNSKTTDYLTDGERVQVIGRAGNYWLQIKTDQSVCFITGIALR